MMIVAYSAMMCVKSSMIFIFFQAEDGIRDYKVTGVQTCALPIYPLLESRRPHLLARCRRRRPRGEPEVVWPPALRSEERRVGKECRSKRTTEKEKAREHSGRSVKSYIRSSHSDGSTAR